MNLVRNLFFFQLVQKGQALLVVILIMAVSLTVGLSMVARSITNSRTSNEEENSQRAFSAAEAGIQFASQSAVMLNINKGIQFNNYASATASATVVGNTPLLVLDGGDGVQQDQGVDLWLMNHDTSNYSTALSGNLTVYWQGNTSCTAVGSPSQINTPALEFLLLTGSSANAAVLTHYVIDPCATNRNNNFSNTSLTLSTSGISSSDCSTYNITNCSSYNLSTTISNISNGLLMRIVPLYAGTLIAVKATNSSGSPINLPKQGTQVTSLGAAGGTQRELIYYQGYPMLPPELFQYSFFAYP